MRKIIFSEDQLAHRLWLHNRKRFYGGLNHEDGIGVDVYRPIKYFAVIPVKIGTEERWFETVYILQKDYGYFGEWGYSAEGFQNFRFVEENEYLEMVEYWKQFLEYIKQ
jgi:hypothetical protein